ncbi:MAG: phosphoribosylamine--glycine ligase [Myxococcota bacterium]
MRALVIGSGGREHALCWRLTHESHEVHAAPGSDGIAQSATCHPEVDASDHDAVTKLASSLGVDVVIVGPEAPLVAGLADRLRAAGVPTFGPGARAAELEGSKATAKAFMARAGIPTAAHRTVTELSQAVEVVDEFVERFGVPPVVKADGLAAGKGVVVAQTADEAKDALRAMMADGAHGGAGRTCVLEQRLVGKEVSLFVLTDGTRARTLLPAADHKRIGEGDTGPNTGGMGAYVPAPVFDAAVSDKARSRIVAPTLAALAEEKRPFVGVLFIGLMIDPSGDPFVIEYNCRFGDPEIQPLLFGASEPVAEHLLAAARGELSDGTLSGRPAVTVVAASAGYPASSRKGDVITGLDVADGQPDVQVFHAGTQRDSDGRWVTHGGRVLGVCARADTLAEALPRAYAAAAQIRFDGMQLRRDIGAQAVL